MITFTEQELNLNIKDVQRQYKERLQGTYVKHPTIGEILITRTAFKETTHFMRKYINVLLKLDEIIKTSSCDGKLKSLTKLRKDDAIGFYYLRNTLQYGEYKINILVSILVDKQGNKYYMFTLNNKIKNENTITHSVAQPSRRKYDGGIIVSNNIITEFLKESKGTNIIKLGDCIELEIISKINESSDKLFYATTMLDDMSNWNKKDREKIFKHELTFKEIQDAQVIFEKLADDIRTSVGDPYEHRNEIVSNSNKPLPKLYEQIAYRGDHENINNFELNKLQRGDYGFGVYFTHDKGYASNYGKVKQYTIPDGEYLLDDEDSINYQSQYVQSCLYDIIDDLGDKSEPLTDVLDRDYSNGGASIYNALSKILGSSKNASEYLDKHGIKGISSFRGNCIVIFNPESIKQNIEEEFKMNLISNIEELNKWLEKKPNEGEKQTQLYMIKKELDKYKDWDRKENSIISNKYKKKYGYGVDHTQWSKADQEIYYENLKLQKKIDDLKEVQKQLNKYNPPIITQLNLFSESLEKITDDIYATQSDYDVLNLLKNKPKNYKIIWDENIHYYLVGDGDSWVHGQIMEKAMNQGLYYDLGLDTPSKMSDYFIDELDQDNVAFLCFYPEDSHSIDSDRLDDGYPHKYYYPFGVIYARYNVLLPEIPLYNILGKPLDYEELNESFIGENNMNEKLIKTVIKPGVQDIIYDDMESETGLNDLIKELQKNNKTFKESLNESEECCDLYSRIIDCLYSNDLTSYKNYLDELEECGKKEDFINYAKNQYGLTEDNIDLNIVECEGGATATISNGGGFSAQLGTAPTAAGPMILGQPVEGKSIKSINPKRRKKKKVQETIEVGKEYNLRGFKMKGDQKPLFKTDTKFLVLDKKDNLIKCKNTSTGETNIFYDDMFIDGDNVEPLEITDVTRTDK